MELKYNCGRLLFLGAEIGEKCYEGNPHGPRGGLSCLYLSRRHRWPTGQGARAGCELDGEQKASMLIRETTLYSSVR